MSRRQVGQSVAQDPAANQAAESLTQLASRAPPVAPSHSGNSLNSNNSANSNANSHSHPAVDGAASPTVPPSLDSGRSSYSIPQPGLQRAASANQAHMPTPTLARSSSAVTAFSSHTPSHASPGFRPSAPDWRATVTIEERQEVRKRIRAAYRQHAATFDEMVELVCAVEEEFLHLSAPSRLDYIKSSLQYDKRLLEKRKHLTGDVDMLQFDTSHAQPQPHTHTHAHTPTPPALHYQLSAPPAILTSKPAGGSNGAAAAPATSAAHVAAKKADDSGSEADADVKAETEAGPTHTKRARRSEKT